MSLSKRLSNGWKLGKTSLQIIHSNPKLLAFPVFSSIALLLVFASFLGGLALTWGTDLEAWLAESNMEALEYVLIFSFYLINYFIIVFFNVGLVYAARQIFEGKEVTFAECINFSASRLVVILQWSVLAATVGVILNTLQERLGWAGKIIVGIIGMVWSIATYFVVPVLAFENLQPIDAIKRSGAIIKEKWGESLAANVGFGLFFLIGYAVILLAAFALGYVIHPVAGVVVGVLSALLLHTIVAAAQTVFLAAAYQHLNDEPYGDFSGETLDSVFIQK
ncbi:MAG: DUF6159 family protein [Bacteroidota bacterium]